MKAIICFLAVVMVVSVNGRLTFKNVLDDVKNHIPEVAVDSKGIHIDLPVYTTEKSPPLTEISIANTTELPECNSTEITDNSIDSKDFKHCQPEVKPNVENATVEPKPKVDNSTTEPTPKVDNGTALILTPYIKENRILEARNASRIDPSIIFGFESYSGFITVNETYNSNVFFWYFPVVGKPVNETPWIVWLQGGPGASSLIGLFQEIGPFYSDSEGHLGPNRFTWLRNHSLLFIDNPVGTGYSFTDHLDGYVTDMDTYGAHLYETVRQFLQVFPELRQAPLFVAGESYGGKYVPALAAQVHRHRGELDGDVNLQGIMVGNGYVEPAVISQKLLEPMYYFGLLSAEQIDILRPLWSAFQADVAANRSTAAKKKWNDLIVAIVTLTGQTQVYNFLSDEVIKSYFKSFLATSEAKRGLHVGDTKYHFVNGYVNQRLSGEFLTNAKPFYEELLENYRVMAYCGQLDEMLPCALSAENHRTWRWQNSTQFVEAPRYPFYYNQRMAGYYKTGGNLTEVVVRGAGHMAPKDAPGPVQQLITSFTHGLPINPHPPTTVPAFVRKWVQNHTSSLFYL